jgi:hypothetical protein
MSEAYATRTEFAFKEASYTPANKKMQVYQLGQDAIKGTLPETLRPKSS